MIQLLQILQQLNLMGKRIKWIIITWMLLNNLVSGYFDLAEISAIEQKPMYMSDYVAQLDAVLTSGNRKLLENSGKVSHNEAMKKAKTEYRKYQEIILSPVEEA